MKDFKKRGLGLVLAAAAVLSTFSACGAKKADDEGGDDIEASTVISGEILTAGKAADNVFSLCADTTASMNPITTTNTLNQTVDCLVYDRLFEVDNNFEVSSRILSDWYYVDNGESGVWVLTLKQGIPMHDGSTLTAEDVIYSVSRVFSQAATHYQKQLGTCYSSGSGDTVYISGNFKNALHIYDLALPIIKANSILENAPAGSGPYKFSEDLSCLEKFDQYEGAENLPLDKIYLHQYTDSEYLITDYESALVDLTVNDPSSIYNMGYGGKNEKRVINTTNLQYIGFNSASEFFSYDQYRTAITYLVNRQAIVDDVLDGAADATALPIHPASSFFDQAYNDSLSYDTAKALEELEKLGLRDMDEDGMLEYAFSGAKKEIDIRFIVCADNASKVQAAKRIAEDMEAIGLGVNVMELSWADYKAALNDRELKDGGTFDMYYAETALSPDWNTLALFESLEDEDNVTNLNFGRWTRENAEDAVYGFLGAVDEDRPAAIQTMLQALSTNAMFVPVCFEKKEVLSHLGIIKGMNPNQYNIFMDITNWTIDLDD